MVRGTTELEIRGPGYKEKVSFWVVQGLGVPVLLGALWLRAWNPTINWQTRELTFSDGVRWKADKGEVAEKVQKMENKIGRREQIEAVGLCANLRQPEMTDEMLITTKPDDLIELPDWLKPYRSVFDEPGKMDREGRVKHTIRLQEGAVPCNKKPYRMSIDQKDALSKELSKFIQKEWIRPSHSEWATLALVVPKKDGTMRVCIDYRDLNAVSLLDAYPLPRIDELLNKLAKARWYSKVDLASGYHQIPMEEDSIKYTGFRVGDPVEGCSFFEWVVMPMGLASAPATFQRWMEWALQGLESCILIYLDDVLIYSLTEEQHRTDVEAVMKRFEEKNMRVKWEKCEFAKEKMKFLGHRVQGGKIMVDEDKLSLLKTWIPPLKTVKQVRQLMGFLSYYRAFIPRFSTLTAPLTELLKGKQTEIAWTEAATEAVNHTKRALLDACQRFAWDSERPCRVTTDASGVGVGATLEQKVDGIGWAPVAFWSRKLSDAEKRYSITDQEWLAVVEAVTRHWRHLLKGIRFVLRTDHSPLRQLLKTKGEDFSNRQLRWFERLSEFNFEVEHLPGQNNQVADALSRAFIISALEVRQEAGRQKRIGWEEIKSAVEQDDDYQKLKEEITTCASDGWIINDSGLIEDGGGRLLVPKDTVLRMKIILEAHEPAFVGHFGIKKTRELVRRNWRWSSLDADVERIIGSCNLCQRARGTSRKDEAPIELMIAEYPWEMVTIDFLSGFVPSVPGRWEGCVIVCDRFSRMMHVKECSTHPTALQTAILFVQLVFRAHGLPRCILSDRGSQFDSQFVEEPDVTVGHEGEASKYASPTNKWVD